MHTTLLDPSPPLIWFSFALSMYFVQYLVPCLDISSFVKVYHHDFSHDLMKNYNLAACFLSNQFLKCSCIRTIPLIISLRTSDACEYYPPMFLM